MKIKRIVLFIFIYLIMPITTFAYSDEVYLGGDNIGIEVKTKGILVIGLYKVNNDFIAKSSGIEKGDYIIKINDNIVNTIDDFSKEIVEDNDKKDVKVEYKRNNKIYTTNLKIYNDNNSYKTGLYIKDEVSGIGTLTLIDPSNNRFLALGHAVYDNSTNNILDIDNGSIYSSYITGIDRSSNGSPGEKLSESNYEDKYGIVTDNKEEGLFGTYEKDIGERKLIKVASIDEIKLGEASIYTVVDGNEIKEYHIRIDRIDKNDSIKNILFTVTDSELLDKTGGIIQGMSGSPIVQNNKIVGAINHVIVDDCTKGYGIFITNMLKES